MSTEDPSRARRLIVPAAVLIVVGLSAVAFRATRDRMGHVTAVRRDTAAYRAEWEAWKSKRVKALLTPGRPLSYTALAWLHPGRNTIGASARSDIHLAGSGVPATVGTLIRIGDEIRFEPAPGAAVTIDSQPARATILRTDADSLPSQVRVGSAGWRIAGRFTPLPVPRKFAASTESGVAEEYEEVGSVDATVDATPYRLTAYDGGKKQLFITFADASSGEETYGFRFLRATLDSATNNVALDFNFAYNPYFALSIFFTFPRPPPRTGSEQRYSPGSVRRRTGCGSERDSRALCDSRR